MGGYWLGHFIVEIPAVKWGLLRFEVVLLFRLVYTEPNFANRLPFSRFQTYPALDLFIFAPFLDSNRNGNFSELFLRWADISLTTMPMGNPIGIFSVKWLAVHPWSNFAPYQQLCPTSKLLQLISSYRYILQYASQLLYSLLCLRFN